ncbi:MAG: N-acetylmuramoyl-L-alanine amidase [Bacteroidota bacterium]|nr:N-acetylmuramoyl-L-alanine amidase [Bacteroidota bacterium]
MSKLIKLYHLDLLNAKWVIFLSFFIYVMPNTAISQQTKKKITKVVIDPGHGGKDSGTMGTKRYKRYEKHISLAISLKLGSYIEKKYPEIELVYTRKKDVFLELRERTELANKFDADLFISIHCDGFTNSNASGASVFVMGMSKLKANMDVAMRENSVIYLEDNYEEKYEGFDPQSPESYIVFSLMQNTYLNQSISFAENIERQFATRSQRKSRGVKQAPFYVISRVNMPSVLIEAGFLTNPVEEDFLHSEKGQDDIATSIYKAFSAYKESIENFDLNSVDHQDMKQVSNKAIFKIQLATSVTSIKENSLFLNLDVQEVEAEEGYKYFIGETENKNEIDSVKNAIVNKGFQDAFIVAFYQGMQISVKEALNLQKTKKDYE